MTYVAVKKHLSNGQPEETMQKYIQFAVETFRLLMMPPADKVSLVFDLNGFGLRNMDWTTLLYVLSILEKYYPESLGTLYVLNAPWIFNGVWKGLAPMLDPVVRAKVQFIKKSDDAAQVIPPDRFIADLGGEAHYAFHYPHPQPGDDPQSQDTQTYIALRAKRDEAWIAFATATREWCTAAGAEDRALLSRRRLFAKKIRAAHWDLEPYYRPKTSFDRMGVTDRRGLVTWLYPQGDGTVLRQVCGRAYAAPTLRREVRDIEEGGLSVDEAEMRTRTAIQEQDWVALYGSLGIAAEVEGKEHVRVPDDTLPPREHSAPPLSVSGSSVARTLPNERSLPNMSSGASAASFATAKPAADTYEPPLFRPVAMRRDSTHSNRSADSFASALSEMDGSPAAAPADKPGMSVQRRMPGIAYRQIGGPMALEVGQEEACPSPGSVGNLTSEQEQHLRDMWAAYFACKRYVESSAPARSGAVAGDSESSGAAHEVHGEPALTDEIKQVLDSLVAAYGSTAVEHIWEFIKMDDPDSLFLRFLRARKWNVSDALVMAIDCIKWRLDYGVEALVRGGDLGNAEVYDKFLDQQRVAKTYAEGTSATQQPICYIHVAKHITSGQPPETMEKYVVFAMETFRLLMSPPQEKATLLFDLTGFGLKNMDWNTVGFIIKCFESFYPECLGTLFVHNAPWLFSGIWRGIAPMLDPVVRSKIIFSSSAKDCAEIVPPGRLLAVLGGNVDNGFRFLEPVPGENELLNDKPGRDRAQAVYNQRVVDYENATRDWIAAEGKDPAVINKRAMVTKQLRVAQYDLEPYVRGKTVYHRNGTLDGQGKVTWLYRQKDGHLIRHVVGRISCVGTLEREIAEMQAGASLEEVERKSSQALKTADWLSLYGDPAVANHLEGTTYPVPGAEAVPEAVEVEEADPMASATAAAAAAVAATAAAEHSPGDGSDPRYRTGCWAQAQPRAPAEVVRAFAPPAGADAPVDVSWTESMASSVTGIASELAERMNNLQDFALNAPGVAMDLLAPYQRSTSPGHSPGGGARSRRASNRLSAQFFSAISGSGGGSNESPAAASLRVHQRTRSAMPWSSSWFSTDPSSQHHRERISTTADLQAAAANLAEHLSSTASEWTNGLYGMVLGSSSSPTTAATQISESPVSSPIDGTGHGGGLGTTDTASRDTSGEREHDHSHHDHRRSGRRHSHRHPLLSHSHSHDRHHRHHQQHQVPRLGTEPVTTPPDERPSLPHIATSTPAGTY